MRKREGFALTVLALILLTSLVNVSLNDCKAQGPIEITNVVTGRMIGILWVQTNEFLHGETMSLNVTAQNTGADDESTTIYASAFDEINQFFGSAKTDVAFSAGESKSVVLSIYIPTWAYSGNACQVDVFTTSSNETSQMFSILPETASQLTVNCLAPMTSLDDVGVTIDGSVYWPPLTIPLLPGNHALQVPRRQRTVDEELIQTYVFTNWNDGSVLTSRTLNIAGGTNKTLNAYYDYFTVVAFRRLVLRPTYTAGCTL